VPVIHYINGVFNYDPKTDQYKWVNGNSFTDIRNMGELGIPSDNHTGNVVNSLSRIDQNDNIWFLPSGRLELWMFNTTRGSLPSFKESLMPRQT
jgi:hypothetical protein